jgi:DNA polymerase-1
MSKDENLIEGFVKDKDVHTFTAARIFGIKEEDVGPQERSIGKMVNFSIIYGVSPYGLSQRTGLSYRQAEAFIKEYFELYPQVREYLTKTVAFAKTYGHVRTLFGRKREVPQLRSSDPSVRQEGERIAVNTPIQGTAADIMKLAMIAVHKFLKENGLRTKMILQVHDELVFEVADEETELVVSEIKKIMETVVKLSVPLKVDVKLSDYWE